MVYTALIRYLPSLLSSHSKGEKCGFFRVSWHFELGKGSCMSLNRLANLTLHRVKLHVSSHSMLLSRDPHQQEPLESLVCTVVDDLATSKAGVAIKHLLRLGFTCKGQEDICPVSKLTDITMLISHNSKTYIHVPHTCNIISPRGGQLIEIMLMNLTNLSPFNNIHRSH